MERATLRLFEQGFDVGGGGGGVSPRDTEERRVERSVVLLYADLV